MPCRFSSFVLHSLVYTSLKPELEKNCRITFSSQMIQSSMKKTKHWQVKRCSKKGIAAKISPAQTEAPVSKQQLLLRYLAMVPTAWLKWTHSSSWREWCFCVNVSHDAENYVVFCPVHCQYTLIVVRSSATRTACSGTSVTPVLPYWTWMLFPQKPAASMKTAGQRIETVFVVHSLLDSRCTVKRKTEL